MKRKEPRGRVSKTVAHQFSCDYPRVGKAVWLLIWLGHAPIWTYHLTSSGKNTPYALYLWLKKLASVFTTDIFANYTFTDYDVKKPLKATSISSSKPHRIVHLLGYRTSVNRPRAVSTGNETSSGSAYLPKSEFEIMCKIHSPCHYLIGPNKSAVLFWKRKSTKKAVPDQPLAPSLASTPIRAHHVLSLLQAGRSVLWVLWHRWNFKWPTTMLVPTPLHGQ